MRRESKSEREAWTAFVEEREAAPTSKYHNVRKKHPWSSNPFVWAISFRVIER